MNIRQAMIDAQRGIFPRRIIETETSGAVAAAAPEHVIDIAYDGEEKQLLAEKLPPKIETRNINERIQLRKYFNKKLTEAIKEDKIEEINNEEKPLGKVRWCLQKFTNGGTPYIDEAGVARIDGDKDGPSSYEKWRYEMNDKKRKARLEQERDDANSSFHSPRITQADPEGTIDNQIDQFLASVIDKNS